MKCERSKHGQPSCREISPDRRTYWCLACKRAENRIVVTPTTVLGARLRRLRQELGINQYEMAVFLETGQSRVSHWERGGNEPSLYTLRRYAAVFDRTVAELLNGVM